VIGSSPPVEAARAVDGTERRHRALENAAAFSTCSPRHPLSTHGSEEIDVRHLRRKGCLR